MPQTWYEWTLLLALAVITVGFAAGLYKVPEGFERATDYEVSQQETAR
ncbi:hypothetical protein [Oceaniradius stylonematis]|nr:hypothetical protein [Oceaniradius stylonematis]